MNLGWMHCPDQGKKRIPATVPAESESNGFGKDRWNPALQERQWSFLMPDSAGTSGVNRVHLFQTMCNPPGGELFLDTVLA
jgi:hypothetical protein